MTDESYTEASLAATARSLRSFFLALMSEGFTEGQAMELTQSILPNPKTREAD